MESEASWGPTEIGIGGHYLTGPALPCGRNEKRERGRKREREKIETGRRKQDEEKRLSIIRCLNKLVGRALLDRHPMCCNKDLVIIFYCVSCAYRYKLLSFVGISFWIYFYFPLFYFFLFLRPIPIYHAVIDETVMW